jgi:hypothetical protein
MIFYGKILSRVNIVVDGQLIFGSFMVRPYEF